MMTPQRPQPPPPGSRPQPQRPQRPQGPGQPPMAPDGRLAPRRMGPPGPGGPRPKGGGRGGPPSGGRRPPPPRRSSALRIIGSLIAFIVVVAGAGLGYLLLNPPSELIRNTIISQVKAKTGRDLIIAGPASFTVLPAIGVALQDVSLSGPNGAPNPIAQMQSLTVNVKAMPLLNREIVVDRLTLVKPVIDLRIDAAGKPNWDLAANAPLRQYAQAGPSAVAPASDAAVRGNRLAALKDFALSDVRITGGTVRFTDERVASTQEIRGLNLKAAMPSLQSATVADGDLVWKGQRIGFQGKLTSPADILAEQPAKLEFTASNKLVGASYAGSVAVRQGVDLSGRIAVKSPSARRLAAWFGSALPPVTGFGPFSIDGTLKTAGNITALSNTTFGLDGATGDGDVTVTTGAARPYVKARLSLSELDLNKYLTSAAGGDAAPLAVEGDTDAPAATPTPPATPSSDAIEDLLRNSKTKVYGSVQRAGWSSEALNLTLLGVANIDAQLATGRLLFQNIKVGQTALNVALKNRVMTATLAKAQMYQGVGSGTVRVDGTGKAAAIAANLKMNGLAAAPFLKDVSSIDWLSGTANVDVNVTATGRSQLQLVQTLAGKANANFSNGAIVGFNLPGAIRNISNGNFSGLKKSPAEQTDFSEMKASFDIAQGVARNQDLSLISPLLRVTGAGAVQLPPRTIDYTVKPKLVSTLKGQGGETGLSGLEIPVRISGSWDNPRYEPDLAGVLSDPSKAVDAVRELGQRFKGKNSKEILNDLLGGKDSADSAGSADNKKAAKDLLKNLFGN